MAKRQERFPPGHVRCPAIAYTAWILLIISVNSQMAAASPPIVLSSSLSEGQRVCPGDAIMFTCVTNGSASHAWSSNDYIGQGGVLLEFASYHDPGRIARNRASPIGTQAILVSKEIKENETQGILESQLNVIVTSDYQNPTIECLHVDTGYQEDTSFQLLDDPDAPEGVEIFEIPDNRNSRGSCVLSLQLNHPSSISPDEIPHLTYHVNYQSRRDIITGTSYTFVVQNCTQGLRINVTTVNRCGNVGGSVVDIVPTFLVESEGATQASDRVSAGAIAGITVGVVIGTICLVALGVIVILVGIRMNKKQEMTERHLEPRVQYHEVKLQSVEDDEESLIKRVSELQKKWNHFGEELNDIKSKLGMISSPNLDLATD